MNCNNDYVTLRLTALYHNISLWLLSCAIILRLLLPGLTVTIGENAFIWLFAWGSFLFAVIDAQYKQYWYFKNPLLIIIILAWILFAFLTELWAIDRMSAHFQNLIWSSDIVIFFTICYFGKDKKTYRYIINILLSCFVLEIFYGIYQYFLQLPALQFYIHQNVSVLSSLELPKNLLDIFYVKLNIPNIFGHFTLTNSLGGYLILYIPILITLCCSKTNKKMVPATLLILSLIVLIMSGSRGSFLSLLSACLIWIIYYYFKIDKKRKLIILIIFSTSFLTLLLSKYTHIFDFIGTHGLTLVMRIGYLAGAAKICNNFLICGVGIDNFKHHYYKYKDVWTEEVNKTHNCYFQWFTETGLIGTVILITLILVIFFILQKKNREKAKNFFPETFWGIYPLAAIFCGILTWLLGRGYEFEAIQIFLKQNCIEMSHNIIYFIPYIITAFAAIIWFTTFYLLNKVIFNKVDLGLKIGLLAFGLHNLLDIDFYVPTLSQNFWIFLALLISQIKFNEKFYKVKKTFKILSLISISIIVIWLSFFKVPELIKITYLKRSINSLKEQINKKNPQDNYEILWNKYSKLLKESIDIAPWNIKFKNSYVLFSLQQIENIINKYSNKNIDIENLKNFFLELRNQIPNQDQISNYFAITSFYIKKADIWKTLNNKKEEEISLENARISANKLLELYPYKIKFLLMAAQIAKKQKKFTKALEYYKKALYVKDLNRGYTDNIVHKIIQLNKFMKNTKLK